MKNLLNYITKPVKKKLTNARKSLVNFALAGGLTLGSLGFWGTQAYAQMSKEEAAVIVGDFLMQSEKEKDRQLGKVLSLYGLMEHEKEVAKAGSNNITINYGNGNQAILLTDSDGNPCIDGCYRIWINGEIRKYPYEQSVSEQRKEREMLRTTAKINKTWVEHNAYEDGEKGMRIHAKIRVNKGNEYFVGAYFCDRKGDPLKDKDGKYCTIGGEVMVGKTLTSSYENSNFSDVELFIPDEQLEIKEKGTHLLQFHICVWDLFTSEVLDQTEWAPFEYFLK